MVFNTIRLLEAMLFRRGRRFFGDSRGLIHPSRVEAFDVASGNFAILQSDTKDQSQALSRLQ
jgi:hypothetical protein